MKSPYPTPAFFAVGEVRASEPKHLRFAAHLDADEGVLQTPFDALAESLERIEGRLARMEGERSRAADDLGGEDTGPP